MRLGLTWLSTTWHQRSTRAFQALRTPKTNRQNGPGNLSGSALSYAIADTCPDRAALQKVFDVYTAGSDRMNGLPVGDRFLELLRESLDDMRSVIERG